MLSDDKICKFIKEMDHNSEEYYEICDLINSIIKSEEDEAK